LTEVRVTISGEGGTLPGSQSSGLLLRRITVSVLCLFNQGDILATLPDFLCLILPASLEAPAGDFGLRPSASRSYFGPGRGPSDTRFSQVRGKPQRFADLIQFTADLRNGVRYLSGWRTCGGAGHGSQRTAITSLHSARRLMWRSEKVVAFLLSLVLFIGVCGFLDTRLLWPSRPRRGRK
jgi:hypothetical protein